MTRHQTEGPSGPPPEEWERTLATRVGYWLVGALLGLCLAWAIQPAPGTGFYLMAFWMSFFSLALLGEIVILIRRIRRLPPLPDPTDTRPADGRVEVAAVRGALAQENPQDLRFRKFLAFEAAEAAPRPARRRAPPPLLGRVVFASVFVGRDGADWSDAECAKAHAALTRAGEWVERQAIRWEAPVNIALADTYFATADDLVEDVEVTFVPEGEGAGPFEADATVKAVAGFSRAARRLGFRDAVDLTRQAGSRIEADALVWLLHLRRAGRSHAVRVDDDTLPGVALAVCYAREENFPEPLAGPPFVDPVTIVHELMHLFGASDKYGVPLRSFPPRSVTERDVMILSFESLSRLRVDPLTAGEIGWGRGNAKRVDHKGTKDTKEREDFQL